VFVLIEPCIEQEGLELHASTSDEKFVPLIDSASRHKDDFLVYEGLESGRLPLCKTRGWAASGQNSKPW
jgi:hypothetical protein